LNQSIKGCLGAPADAQLRVTVELVEPRREFVQENILTARWKCEVGVVGLDSLTINEQSNREVLTEIPAKQPAAPGNIEVLAWRSTKKRHHTA